MNRVIKKSLLALLALGVYFFITIGLGTNGIGKCEPGAIIMYLIGCAGYGWFFGSLVGELIRGGK